MKQIFHARKHRERSQPAARASLGLLEKHKDYKLRSADHHRKQKAIKALKQKARLRNPDEFYFAMLNSQLVEGLHTKKPSSKASSSTNALDADQQKLAKTQDLSYIRSKIIHDAHRIEKIKSVSSLSSGIMHFEGCKKKWNEQGEEEEDQREIDLSSNLQPSQVLLEEIQSRTERMQKLAKVEAALTFKESSHKKPERKK